MCPMGPLLAPGLTGQADLSAALPTHVLLWGFLWWDQELEVRPCLGLYDGRGRPGRWVCTHAAEIGRAHV